MLQPHLHVFPLTLHTVLRYLVVHVRPFSNWSVPLPRLNGNTQRWCRLFAASAATAVELSRSAAGYFWWLSSGEESNATNGPSASAGKAGGFTLVVYSCFCAPWTSLDVRSSIGIEELEIVDECDGVAVLELDFRVDGKGTPAVAP